MRFSRFHVQLNARKKCKWVKVKLKLLTFLSTTNSHNRTKWSSLPRRELHWGWSLRVETIPIRLEKTQTSIYRYRLKEVGFIHIMENYTAIHGVRNSSIHYYQIFRKQNYTTGQERENIYSLLIFIYKSVDRFKYSCVSLFFFFLMKASIIPWMILSFTWETV